MFANRQYSRVDEHDSDVRFQTTSRYKAISRTHIEKYTISPLFMAELPKFPRLTEIGVEETTVNITDR